MMAQVPGLTLSGIVASIVDYHQRSTRPMQVPVPSKLDLQRGPRTQFLASARVVSGAQQWWHHGDQGVLQSFRTGEHEVRQSFRTGEHEVLQSFRTGDKSPCLPDPASSANTRMALSISTVDQIEASTCDPACTSRRSRTGSHGSTVQSSTRYTRYTRYLIPVLVYY